MKKTSTGRIRLYYQLAKPGIIYGNLITAIGGFLLASRGDIELKLLAATLIGIALVIASGCVFNNIVDRDIDQKMARTHNRAIPAGLVALPSALVFGAFLGLSGILVLAIYTNQLTLILGLVALFSYVVLYGLAKRRTVHGTLIGTVPGAASVVAGYTAVSNQLDIAALILFLILVFWQMAHFYSIAIFRLKDYEASGIPVLPAKRGVYITKVYVLLYIMAFIAAALSLSVYGYSSYGFAVVMSLLGLIWLIVGFQGFNTKSDALWALRMFKLSLVVILGLGIMLSLDAVL